MIDDYENHLESINPINFVDSDSVFEDEDDIDEEVFDEDGELRRKL